MNEEKAWITDKINEGILRPELILPSSHNVCPRCGSGFARAHGYQANGKKRLLCKVCGRTRLGDIERCTSFYPCRIPETKCVQLLQLIESGLTMRGAALNVGVNRNTATNIIRVSGYVRRCRTCGKPITGNRFWYCSNGCQEWKKKQRERVVQPKTPLYDATANILRTLELGSCDDHVSLALKAAEDISERNAAYYLGAAYEGIADACLEGITDEEELLSRAKDSIKRQWKETITWAKSLDGLKDACGYEPSVMLE